MSLTKITLMALVVFSLEASAQGFTADNCLDGQSMYAEDIDISKCPELPSLPESAELGNTGKQISLGAWELGTTAEGHVYKYGSLDGNVLSYDDGTTTVNQKNITCWAKGYYRLRKILQNPPKDYVKLNNANFQVRFFQFQTDLRNGSTGYMEISSYRDHLVKWVTVIDENGVCVQPTLKKFKQYLTGEIARRGL